MLRTLPERLIAFAMRHARLVVAVTLALTIVLAWFALKVRINPDFFSLIPKNTRSVAVLKEYSGGQSTTDVLVVAVTADGSGGDVFEAGRLEAFSEAVTRIGSLPGITSFVSPFNLVSFGREKGRLAIRTMGPEGRAPAADGVGEFKARLLEASYARNLVVSADGQMLIAYFQAERRTDYTGMMQSVRSIVAVLRSRGLVPYVTGSVPMQARTGYYLNRDFSRLLILAALIVVLCYAAGYRSVRGVMLPLLSVLLGTLWTVGFMGLAGISLSLISIVAPPLILIFGNEYGIYSASELDRVAREEGTSPGWIGRAISNVGKPIVMAFLTTAVGFLSLMVTDISQTREFAIAASVGSLACAFLALFFLPAMQSLLRPPAFGPARTRRGAELLPTAMRAVARFVLRYPALIFALLAATVVVFAVTWRMLVFNTDGASYYPPHDELLTDMHAIYGRAGGFEQISVSFDAPGGSPGYFLDAGALARVSEVEQALRSIPDVSAALSLPDILRAVNRAATGTDDVPTNRAVVQTVARLVSAATAATPSGAVVANMSNRDFTRLTVALRVYNSHTGRSMDEQRLRELLDSIQVVLDAHPTGAAAVVWGDLVPVLAFADSLRRSLFISMAISVGSILLLTVLVFRSFLVGLYPLVPLGAGLLLNFTMMALARIPLDLTTIMVSNISIGVGVDSAIYLVIQFRRELQRTGGDPDRAVEQTIVAMGRPVLLSALSIVAGLLVFLTAAFLPVRFFGILVIVSLAATTLGTLVTLPALLVLHARTSRARARRRARVSA